ncbi:RnfABCDGE type electron transport complex subunit D [Echinimonas agarilytica]|uniref:Ion-translocating oxidoreductase complex subunit D n=1 Tax=Echinimonas agarilytica TaxID=1215918 RepID=A0AA41W8U3_9GAMM|nr:RnfABCDGE type electron transport complex subunit D [Echinimonas agarilytica]MCM2680451.1 RnfABCDGE type electron transport complex subunit D [Echinimonas agarilytica]
MKYHPVASPHTHGGNSTTTIMYLVVAALLPTTFYGIYCYGFSAATTIIVAIAVALICEWVCLLLLNRKRHAVFDGSAILTALLLALSLPPDSPVWLVAIGATFAIVIGKQVYGGLGQNLFNPAMLARVMLLICFPIEMTDWTAIAAPQLVDGNLVFSQAWLGVDAISSATPLASDSDPFTPMQLFNGYHASSIGEGNSLLILLGGLFLIGKGVIRYVLPLAVIAGVVIPAAVFHLIWPESYLSPLQHVFSGALMLTAFFIATDMVTSPTSIKGQWVFGLGVGTITWLIRSFGNYPEGAAFAVLIMNSATPLIDHYLRPRIFGSEKPLLHRGG